MAQPLTQEPIIMDARQFSLAHARRQLQRLTLQLNRAARSCNADAVHDCRVAIRRFTQAIAVCQPFLPSAGFQKRRKRLKQIMKDAGEVRNQDVALKLISKFRPPHAAHLRANTNSARKESARRLVAHLKGWSSRRISSQLRLRLAPGPPAGNKDRYSQSINDLAHHVLGRIAKDFHKQGKKASEAEASTAALHRFRIAAKKFRYALEIFQPVFHSSLDPLVASVKSASALLGDVNDCATVAEMVADSKGGAQLGDRLKKRQHKKTEEFRDYWKKEFADAEPLKAIIVQLNLPEPAATRKPVASSLTSDHRERKSA
jgi:CHAD domain-containing protein